VITLLNILQWSIVILAPLIAAYKLGRRHLDHWTHNYLSRIVIGSGNVTRNNKLIFRTFAERDVAAVIGESVLAGHLISAAHAVTKDSRTQLVLIKDAIDRHNIRTRLTSALNELSKPWIVGELTGLTGPVEFVVAIAAEDHADQRKIRQVIVTVEELHKHQDPSLHQKPEYYLQPFHDHRGRLLHELAKKWFADPTKDNKYAWVVTLQSQVLK
jgi:hypothetical protein